jgi:hypothetical protein
MNAIKTLTALSFGLAVVVPAAHADRGDRYNGRDAWSQQRYERVYDRRYDARAPRRDIVVERPVYVHPAPPRRVVVERPVYVQPAPVYHPAYPRYYESRPSVNGGTVVGAIGGAIVGSILGSQIGYGEHQGAATVAGAIIGGAIGSDW